MSFVAVSLGITAASTGLALYGSAQKNDAISRSAKIANQGAAFEISQEGAIAGVQSLRSQRRAEQVRGIVAVSGASRGVGAGGSVAALQRNSDLQAGLDQYSIDVNRYGAERRTLATLGNLNAQFDAEQSNSLLSGLQGGLSGLSTGLSLGHAFGYSTPFSGAKSA